MKELFPRQTEKGSRAELRFLEAYRKASELDRTFLENNYGDLFAYLKEHGYNFETGEHDFIEEDDDFEDFEDEDF